MDRINGLGTVDGDMKDPKMDLCSIIKCEQCLFWCSDPRYITLHNEIAHGTTTNVDTEDVLSHPSAKKFKADQTEALDPKNKANIEQMIKLTHSLMSHLYSTLLDCSVTENENDVSSILERVVPDSTQQTSSHLLNSTLNNSNSLNFTDQTKNAARLLEKLNSLQNPKINTLPSSLTSSPSQPTITTSIPAIVSVKSATPEHENNLNHLDSNGSGSTRKRKREDKEDTPILDIQSLLTKNMLNNKNVLNTTSNGEIDRTQLLIETIRAAQAAHAKQLESGQTTNSDDETDAVVNPMEPEPNDLKKEKSDEDEIEIIHMTDEPESISFESEKCDSTLAFPSSDTLSRFNSMSYGRNILSQIQKTPNFNTGSAVSLQRTQSPSLQISKEMKYESPKAKSSYGTVSSTSDYSLVTFASQQSAANQQLAPKTPISCSICGSHWRTPSALNIHMRVHTGEKPYKCYICGKGHKQKGQLKVHINKHHPGQWSFGQVYCKDPKKCSMCGEVYTDPKDLSKHILECNPTRGMKAAADGPLSITTSSTPTKEEPSGGNTTSSASSSPPTRLSDFNSNQNSSVNAVAETLLARLKSNPAIMSFNRPGINTTSLSSSVSLNGIRMDKSGPLDFQKLAANLSLANQIGGNSGSTNGNSTRNTSSESISSTTSVPNDVPVSTNPVTNPLLDNKIEVKIDKSQMTA